MVAPGRSLLRGPVEVDEFYVGGIAAGRGGGGDPAPPRRSLSSRSSSGGRVPGAFGSVRFPISNGSLCGFVQAAVDRGAVVRIDAWQDYRRLGTLGYDLRPVGRRPASGLSAGGRPIPANRCCHAPIARSNLKAWLHGTHRDVSREHLQVYLDEFVFPHNRRRTPMLAFQTLLGLGASRPQ